MNSECQHLDLKKCLVGESVFYKCSQCKRSFTAEPMQIKVTYPVRCQFCGAQMVDQGKGVFTCDNKKCKAPQYTEPCGKDERCQP